MLMDEKDSILYISQAYSRSRLFTAEIQESRT